MSEKISKRTREQGGGGRIVAVPSTLPEFLELARAVARDIGLMTLEEIHTYASTAAEQLDGRHGDPSRNANWCRERDFATIILALLYRISAPVQIEVRETPYPTPNPNPRAEESK